MRESRRRIMGVGGIEWFRGGCVVEVKTPWRIMSELGAVFSCSSFLWPSDMGFMEANFALAGVVGAAS